ncbi:MAG TPA: hypothetical protein VN039_05720, partial [Nitrospira sp.]|nr:hypothetical protein [Nitrospira sp.]
MKAVWYEAIDLMKSGTFPTKKALAEHYYKAESWAERLVREMVSQSVFTKEQIREIFPQASGAFPGEGQRSPKPVKPQVEKQQTKETVEETAKSDSSLPKSTEKPRRIVYLRGSNKPLHL